MVASLDTTGFPYGALTRYNLGFTYLKECMKSLAVYYSLIGKTGLVARPIAEAPNTTLLRLDCLRN